jgi:hypothetical protein
MENPSNGNAANVPMRDTGTASIGINVARQLWRNRNTTSITSAIASASVFTISRMPSVTGMLVSSA